MAPIPSTTTGSPANTSFEGTNLALDRLQVSHVDLIYAHRPDRNTPIEETVRAFNHLIAIGEAIYWGTSEWDADEIATAWRIAGREGIRTSVRGEEDGLGLTVFSPLKIGILTGKYNDGIPADSRLGSSTDPFVKRMNDRFGGEDWVRDIDIVRRLKPVSEKLGVSQATLAMAWVLRNKNVSSAITGASKPEQVYDIVRSLEAVHKLTNEVLLEIDEILGNKPAVIVRRFQ